MMESSRYCDFKEILYFTVLIAGQYFCAVELFSRKKDKQFAQFILGYFGTNDLLEVNWRLLGYNWRLLGYK